MRRFLVATVVTVLVHVVGAAALTQVPDPAAAPPPGGRVPTVDAPLRVLVVGDSVMFDTEPALEAALLAAGPARIHTRTIMGFGLSRPDYYDWRTKWREAIADVRPEAVVVMVGPFDTAAVEVGGRRLAPGTPAWAWWYGDIVDEAHDVLTSSGARVFWVGTPWQRESRTRARVAAVNDVYRSVATRAGSTFVDAAAALSGRDGGYEEVAAGPGGRPVRWRKTDGVHLCPDGAAQVAAAVVEAVTPVWGLRPETGWTAGGWRRDPRYQPTIYGGGCPPPDAAT